jgi:hypothetical protein
MRTPSRPGYRRRSRRWSRQAAAMAVSSSGSAWPEPGAASGTVVARWSEFSRGGHFAALEAPDLLTADVRAFFRGLVW